MTRYPALLWVLLLITLCGALALALTSNPTAQATSALPDPLRIASALLFVALGPGLGWVGAMRLPSIGATLLVGVVVSVSLTLLVAIAMAATGTWTVAGGFVALAIIGAAGSAVWLARGPAPGELEDGGA